MHATYDHYKDLKEESCKETLAIMLDAHQWALAAVALLDEKIERLSHSLSSNHWHLRSHKHSGSHCQRFWAGSHQDRAPWWQELSEMPGQTDFQAVDNYYSVPLAPQSLEFDQFLPVSSIIFGRQDYHMRQPQNTSTYTKALQ